MARARPLPVGMTSPSAPLGFGTCTRMSMRSVPLNSLKVTWMVSRLFLAKAAIGSGDDIGRPPVLAAGSALAVGFAGSDHLRELDRASERVSRVRSRKVACVRLAFGVDLDGVLVPQNPHVMAQPKADVVKA